jgi:hypothetical protein
MNRGGETDMPANDKITLPANVPQDELMRRVAERVWELWRREIQYENERQGKKRGK